MSDVTEKGSALEPGGHPGGHPGVSADGAPDDAGKGGLKHPGFIPKGGKMPDWVKKMLGRDGESGASGMPGDKSVSSGRRGYRPGAGPAALAYEERTGIKPPKIMAWEITRSCNLACAHCRASAHCEPYPGELTLDECRALIDDIASFTDPILILTGGEPLMRPDIWEIIDYANERGLHPVIGTNGTLIDDETARKIAEHGIPRVSVSIDFPDAAGQDAFRNMEGAFEQTLAGVRNLRNHGVEVQVNTTITKLNSDKVEAIHDLAESIDAAAFHPFLLVPTGRGEDLVDVELNPQEYEEVLTWAYHRHKTSGLHFKPTDSPQYYRIMRQQAALEGITVTPQTHGMEAMTRGCLGGISFAFISHMGDVQPCGYFDMQLGNVRERPFSDIWTNSPVLDDLRHFDRLKGKCGACEFKEVCGGCRARALEATGDYMEQEPYCAYQPKKWSRQRVLDVVQGGFPVTPAPIEALGEQLDLPADDVADALADLYRNKTVRRVGASFASGGLGYASALCAMAVDGGEDELDRVAQIVGAHPGVTHNYARNNRYNLWFTMIAQGGDAVASEVAALAGQAGVTDYLVLPATKLFKIRVDFGEGSVAGDAAQDGAPAASARDAAPFDPADPFDVELVRWAQGDVLFTPDPGNPEGRPLVERRPFSAAAATIGQKIGRPVGEDEVVARMRELLDLGVARRFGAIVRHHHMGYAANGMTCWDVPDDLVDAVGGTLAASPHVSHCYARPRAATWNANLYGMAHAHSDDELEQIVADLVAAAADAVEKVAPGRSAEIAPPQVLVSTKEYKKTSMRYFP